MTRYLGPKDGNKNGEQSFIQFVSSLFSGQVAAGLAVSQQSTPAMGVSIAPGTAAIPTGNGYPYTIWSTAIENVTLNTADGSNPRIDLIVAYIDLSITNTSSSNSPSGWSFLKVTGTPSGSPVVPNSAAIQAALPNSSYPYIIMAQVAVAAGATTITNANITDMRAMCYSNSAIPTTDANGWVVYNYGTYKVYRQRQLFSATKVTGEYVVISNLNLPVGMATIGNNFVSATMANGFADDTQHGVKISSTGVTSLVYSMKAMASATFAGWVDWEITTLS